MVAHPLRLVDTLSHTRCHQGSHNARKVRDRMPKASPTVQTAPPRTPRSRLLIGVIAVLAFVLTLRFMPRAWANVLILGVVEGVTEFLPISSTGHLLIASNLLGFQHSIGGTFEIFIQLGAVLAVVGFYVHDLLAQARAVRSDPATRRFWLGIVVAFLPAAVVGLLLRDWIKAALFTSPTVIAWSLIAGGLVLVVVEALPRGPSTTQDVRRVSLGQSLGVGVAQVLALLPGVSRSGASIVGGMFAGMDRRTATAFSFYLAIPTLGAGTVVDLLGSLDQITASDIGRLAVGTVTTMAVAWASISWLLRYVANHSFVVFGIYRIIAGVVVLLCVAAGVL